MAEASPQTPSQTDPPPTPTTAVEKFNRFRAERLKLETDFENLRKELSAIRDKLKAGPDEEESIKKEGTPVSPNKTLYILFATAFALSRLINQKLLNKPTAIQFNMYFEIFKKLIKNYEFILKLGSIIAFPIGKPVEETKEEEVKPTEGAQTGGAAPKPKSAPATAAPKPQTATATAPATATPKPQTASATAQAQAPANTSGEPATANESDAEKPPEYLDETLFVQQLRSFHAHLIFSLNETLKGIVQNPTSETFKTDALTEDENKRFATKEFTNTLDTLFTHMNIAYDTMSRDFQTKLNTSNMQKYEDEVKEFNDSVFNFNTLNNVSLPLQRNEEDLQTYALEQSAALKTMMKEGPVKVGIQEMTNVAMEIGDAAKEIQTSLVAHIAPESGSLGLMESIDAWLAAYTAAKGTDETIIKNLKLVKEKLAAAKTILTPEKETESKDTAKEQAVSATPGSGTPGSGTPGSGTPGSGTPGSVPDPGKSVLGEMAQQQQLSNTLGTLAQGIADVAPISGPNDKLKEDITSAVSAVSSEANKAAAAAASIVSAAKGNAPELAAKAELVKKSIDDALAKVQNASSKDAEKIVADLSKTITEGATTLSTLTKDVGSYVAGLDPAAAAALKDAISTAASTAINIAQTAAGAVKGITSKLGPLLHTAALALGATSLTALAASPALPVVAAVASIVMIIMHQKKLHSALVAKMKGYFVILMQMLEIFKIMSIIGSKMSYKIDDGACIHALNEFKAYMYLSAGPDLRKAIETAGENKNSTGKEVKLSWFQKAMSKAQRIFSSSSILIRLDTLFNDVITFFLLSLSKFNIITSVHSDVLQSMKAEIVKLDEIIQFFNKVRMEPVKKCDTEEDCRTDTEREAEYKKSSDELQGALKSAGVSSEDISKVLVATGKAVTEAEKKIQKGGTKRFGRRIGKKRTKRKM